MAPNPRVAKAFRAMRGLGIPEEKTKPVLKRLLKIYDKNWELIEEENYRALADAIFDEAEACFSVTKYSFSFYCCLLYIIIVSKFLSGIFFQAEEQKKKVENTEAEQKKILEQAERMKAIEEETQIQEEAERPLKRLRLRHQDGQASPSSINPGTNSSETLLKRPKLEVDELLDGQPQLQSTTVTEPVRRNDSQPVSPLNRVRNKGKQPILSNASGRLDGSGVSQSVDIERTHPVVADATHSDSDILSRNPKGKGKEHLSPQSARRENILTSDKPSLAVRFKEPKVEPGIDIMPKQKGLALIKPKDEPLTDDPPRPRFEVPLAVIFPDSLANGDTSTETESNLIREPDFLPLTTESAENEDLNNCVQETLTSGRELINILDESNAKLDIASSSSGEIKLVLSCNPAHGKPKLSVPNVDAVLKIMEDKCLNSYKVLDPNFSVKKLMNDMCECLLNLGSDSTNEPPNARPPTDSSEACADVKDSVSTKGGLEAGMLQMPKLSPPSNGNDNDKQIEQNGFENMESESLVIVVNNHSTPDDTTSFDDANDIAKGQESLIISLVNEVNSECPPSFHYMHRNAVFQNAYVNFSLARIGDDNCCPNCFGDCLTSSTPCLCALQSGGEFAYTTEGLVKEDLIDECIKMNRDPQNRCLLYCKECPLERSKNEEILEPCKGHVERSFIKECWLKCGCNKQCGNRVVQRGIKHKLQVFMTAEGKGWGLRTLEDLPKGAFICEYVGEVLTNMELYNRVSQNSNKNEYAHPVLLDADWGAESELKDEEALCLDATHYGNVARFINHRCFDPNLVEIPVEVENPDRHYYHLAFFTTRKVKAFEELTRDYDIDFDDDQHPVKAFECRCGSRFCRSIKPSSRSRKRR
ncbi:probable inactive histone-lysine N-methyltransferase SUVR2 isoform X1 [Cynara cardunculus var. scolymus]|uniref:probable inactive histone-lysine N-methyltransferase SUVR2 isoform X1 n=1 Tax=Cynara cardunculus var. scolymus TaxID=59895 RepID=UPI000D62DC38|nr:probable inactive histone-lysine N-methyltransferase SUVR2 isoform X1 [Cynara cardunculus var. scolymus]